MEIKNRFSWSVENLYGIILKIEELMLMREKPCKKCIVHP